MKASLTCLLLASFLGSTALIPSYLEAATRTLIRTNITEIDGLLLREGGMLWWTAPGTCGGEFPSDAAIGFSATLSPGAPFSMLAKTCTIMNSLTDTVDRDEAYVYHFDAGLLYQKPLNASAADSSTLVLTPPLTPTLLAGQTGSALLVRGGVLYFTRYNASSGLNEIYAKQLTSTANVEKQGQFDSNSPVIEMKYFTYRNGNVNVPALIILTSSGQLYRLKLNPVRGETGVALLATGVNYFTTRNGGFFLSNSYIFATKGTRAVLGDIPGGGVGRLYRVHPETGTEELLYTAQDDNMLIGVTAVGGDNDNESYLFLAEGVVSGPVNGFQSITDVVIRRHDAQVLSGAWDTILLTGGGSNLQATKEKLYFTRGKAIYSLPTGAEPLNLDVSAVTLEAVQAIQSLSHSVPLVANRPIYVRAYASLPVNTSGQNQWFGTAELRGYLNGVELPGSPIGATRSPLIHKLGTYGSMRSDITNSFLFELPESWTRPGSLPINFLQFKFTVNPSLGIPETVSNPLANNSYTSPPALLRRGGTPCLVMIPVYSKGPEYSAISDDLFPQMIERAKSLMPVEDFEVHAFGIAAGDPDDPLDFAYEGSDESDPDEAAEENRQKRSDAFSDANDQAEDLGSESDICDSSDIHYVAMLHEDAVVTPPGGMGENPGNAVTVLMSTSNVGDPQGPRAGRIIAHELGHNYGRSHVACGDFPEDQADFDDIPFPESLGNPDIDLLGATFGFDPLNFIPIRPDMACDTMSYASFRWSTSYFWNGLLGEIPVLASPAPPLASIRLAGVSGKTLRVRGRVFPVTKTALFRPFSILADNQFPARELARSREDAKRAALLNPPYVLRQLRKDGVVLSETPILARSPSLHDHHRPVLHFHQHLDLENGAEMLQLSRGGDVYAERFISQHPPVLELSVPSVSADRSTVSLRWTASDPDGDLLRFSLHYSPDNGAHWLALKTEYRATSIVIDTDRLPGGANCRLRVIAHDGVNSTPAVSSAFTIPSHAPTPVLSGIRNLQHLPFGQALRVHGLAFDPESPSTESRLIWNLAGPQLATGEGREFVARSLIPGDYELKLTAVDPSAASNTVSRSFTVAPLNIPESAIPLELDGLANDAAYAQAVEVDIPFGNSRLPAKLVHADGALHVYVGDLTYGGNLRVNRTVGLLVDVDGDHSQTLEVGDRAFLIDEEGVPFQQTVQRGVLANDLTPDLGFRARIHRGTDRWSAEFQIQDALLGGWGHAVGLMLTHTTAKWPTSGIANQPATWAAAWLGTSAPSANRAPIAAAGPDQILAPGRMRPVYLDGTASYDPENQPLIFKWKQSGGPTVQLSNTTSRICSFLAPMVAADTEYRFSLTVSDGVLTSPADEVRVRLRQAPTPVPFVARPPTAELGEEGDLQLRLSGAPRQEYVVESSIDLVNWISIRRVMSDGDGLMDVLAKVGPLTEPQRFFRARAD